MRPMERAVSLPVETGSFKNSLKFWKQREQKNVGGMQRYQSESIISPLPKVSKPWIGKKKRSGMKVPESVKEDEVVPILTLSVEEFDKKNSQKRSEIIQELLSTEQTYVDNLDTLIRVYIHPLKKDSSIGISSAECSSIFSNIEIIASFHKILFAQFQTHSSDPAPVFLKYADFLKMYTHYLKSYETSVTTLHTLRSLKTFNRFLETNRSKCEGQTLSSFLILPVQRIPRYEMLLGEIVRLTHPESEGYKTAKDAFNKVKEAAQHVNESQRKFESLAKLLDIQSKLKNEEKGFTVVAADRLLVREREISVRVHSNLLRKSAVKSRLLFVFSDCLLLTKTDYTFLKMMSFGGISVEMQGTDSQPGIQVISSKDEISFICRSREECDDWIDLITTHQSAYNDERTEKWTLKRTKGRRSVHSVKSSEL